MSVFLLALLAAQPAPEPRAVPVPPFIKAERDFAARAQTDGQWTAFRAFAASDAIMLAPDPTNAHQFLARFRTDPVVPVMWWPARAWVSCDGRMAVTTGPWVRRGGTQVGSFTTVWRRESGGEWRWVYDNGRELPRALDAPDEPPVRQPDCPGQPRAAASGPETWLQRENSMPGEWGYPLQPVPSRPAVAGGESPDGTLRWEVHHRPEAGPNAYILQVFQRSGTGAQLVIAEAHGFSDAAARRPAEPVAVPPPAPRAPPPPAPRP